jgi:hypothetical protein
LVPARVEATRRSNDSRKKRELVDDGIIEVWRLAMDEKGSSLQTESSQSSTVISLRKNLGFM